MYIIPKSIHNLYVTALREMPSTDLSVYDMASLWHLAALSQPDSDELLAALNAAIASPTPAGRQVSLYIARMLEGWISDANSRG